MSQSIIYRNLCEVKILHHYFLDKGEEAWDKMNQADQDKMLATYDCRDIFTVIPTSSCGKHLRSHQCIFKNTQTGFFIGVKVKPHEFQPQAFQPFIPMEENLTFRFLIFTKDLSMLNYTALPLQDTRNKVYVFKNGSSMQAYAFPSLSAIPPVYENGRNYKPGDMLSDDTANQTKLYTALVQTGNDPAISEDWLTEEGDANTPMSYANYNDRYLLVNGFYTYVMKTKDAIPVATLKNSSGQIIHPRIEVLPGDFYSVQVDMQQFPSGIYSMHIACDAPEYHDDVHFYLLNESEVPFGMIEIKVQSGQAAFNLLDNQQLLSPVYELRFRNRKTHWRYVGERFNENSYTLNPFPLTRFGFIEDISVKDKDNNDAENLPNPNDRMIKPEEQKYFSEIIIN